MPVLGPTDPLFTDKQESILHALGGVRIARPNIDLPAIARFDSARAMYYVSDADKDGKLYGAIIIEGEKPRVGHFHRAELISLKRRGRLYRGDLQTGLLTVHEVGRIANMRYRDGLTTTEVIPE